MTHDQNQTEPVKVQPAANWPSYATDHARAELEAMRMLIAGTPPRTVRMRTRLSWAHIRRLSDLVAEEAKNPTTPRNVLRDRRRTRPARVRVVEPRQDVLPSPADTDEPTTTGGPHQPPHQQANAHEKAIASPEPEPEQLSLMCI